MTERTITLIEEDGETVLPLSEEFLNEMGWKIGDDIDIKAEPGQMIMTNLSLQRTEAED